MFGVVVGASVEKGVGVVVGEVVERSLVFPQPVSININAMGRKIGDMEFSFISNSFHCT